MNDFLTEDTKATILLCGVMGKDRSPKPLSLTEYSSLVEWLVGAKMRPGDLLQKDVVHEASRGAGIDKQRLESLLGRGVRLGFEVEKWQRDGIFVITRSDTDYPVRYKKHLGAKSPPLLFGVGNRSLLQGGGLGIVGSRNVDSTGAVFARQTAELCAAHHMPVVSGGARGVDRISMSAALEAGGTTIGILAESLLRKSVERSARQAIADGRLLLLSPYHPHARFTVGAAMGRNKLIYALADYVLVVSAEHEKGGTWAGAEEELKRRNPLPVFVRIGNDVPQGNSKLLDLGAIAWPDSIDRDTFKQQLHDLAVNTRANRPKKNPTLFDFQVPQTATLAEKASQAVEVKEEKSTMTEPEPQAETETPDCPISIYEAVLPVISAKLKSPMTAQELAETLEVNQKQLHTWLKRAVEEKKIVKLSKPVRYQKAANVRKNKSESDMRLSDLMQKIVPVKEQPPATEVEKEKATMAGPEPQAETENQDCPASI